ncbi:hypothetical protein BDR22DRAFT_961777 [Usnea florida]
MSSEISSSQPPVSLQFGNSETTGSSQSFSGFVAGSVQFHSGHDPLDALPRAEGASFNSAELEHERLCLPGTRTKILNLIEQWTVNPQGERIFWLSGMAGTGKSAIARTLAHKLSEKKQLGASFFFSRGRGDRGNASKFFTSIAYQLAMFDAENGSLARSIRKAIDQYPDIFKRAKRDQWKFLVQEPLSQLKGYSTQGVVLVLVIDALDECENDKDVQLILRILCESQGFERIQFRVLVTGRPRLSVRDAFLDIAYQGIVLHDIEQYIVQEDLRTFFGHELGILQRKRRLTGDFLGDGVINVLVQRAGDLFIYAATICLFIAQRKHPPPRERLNIVLQNRAFTQSPEKNLDQLYLQILREAVPTTDFARDRTHFCSNFKVIVGSIVSLFSSLSVRSLAALLSETPESIEFTLDDLWSVLNVPQAADATISLIHPSFRDFLLDRKRCDNPDFWIDTAEAHLVLLTSSLRLMVSSLSRDICDLRLPGSLIVEINPEKIRKHIPPELEYACTSWVRHLENSVQGANGTPGNDVLNTIRHFLEQKTLYWLEALSLLGKMQESVLMLSTLQTIVQSCDDKRLAEFVHDAYRFTLNNRSVIEQAPLQTYCSALVFSPSGSVLRKVFETQLPRWITCVSGNAENWGSLIQTLEGDNYVRAVEFSPDGEKLMCVFEDFAVRIWDARTGTLLHTLQDRELAKHCLEIGLLYSLFNGQNIAFVSRKFIEVWDVIFESWIQTIKRDDIVWVALSPVEQKLASGSSSGTVRVWDITSGMTLQKFEDCAGSIRSLEFSPNGQKLAAQFGDLDHVLLWDLDSASLVQTIRNRLWQHKWFNTSIPLAFSQDGKIIACSDSYHTVGIWDAESGAALQTLGCRLHVKGVAFLPNEQHLACLGYDGTVQVWNVPDGSLLRTFRLDHKVVGLHLVAFSPTDQKLASSVPFDHNVNVWDIAFNSPLSQKLQSHDEGIQQMVFSPNGQKLASLSINSEVCLWDVAAGILRKRFAGSSFLWDNSLAFSPDGGKLVTSKNNRILDCWDTEFGQWLRRDDRSSVNLRAATTIPSYGVSLKDQWVTVNQQRLIRVPPDRRSMSFFEYGTKIAIGSFSGVMTLLDLNLELMQSSIPCPPIAERQVLWSNHLYASDSATEEDDESSNDGRRWFGGGVVRVVVGWGRGLLGLG